MVRPKGFYLCLDCLASGIRTTEHLETECPWCEGVNLKTDKEIADVFEKFKRNRDDNTMYCFDLIDRFLGEN